MDALVETGSVASSAADATYMYVNGDGTVKEPGQKLLDAAQDA